MRHLFDAVAGPESSRGGEWAHRFELLCEACRQEARGEEALGDLIELLRGPELPERLDREEFGGLVREWERRREAALFPPAKGVVHGVGAFAAVAGEEDVPSGGEVVSASDGKAGEMSAAELTEDDDGEAEKEAAPELPPPPSATAVRELPALPATRMEEALSSAIDARRAAERFAAQADQDSIQASARAIHAEATAAQASADASLQAEVAAAMAAVASMETKGEAPTAEEARKRSDAATRAAEEAARRVEIEFGTLARAQAEAERKTKRRVAAAEEAASWAETEASAREALAAARIAAAEERADEEVALVASRVEAVRSKAPIELEIELEAMKDIKDDLQEMKGQSQSMHRKHGKGEARDSGGAQDEEPKKAPREKAAKLPEPPSTVPRNEALVPRGPPEPETPVPLAAEVPLVSPPNYDPHGPANTSFEKRWDDAERAGAKLLRRFGGRPQQPLTRGEDVPGVSLRPPPPSGSNYSTYVHIW